MKQMCNANHVLTQYDCIIIKLYMNVNKIDLRNNDDEGEMPFVYNYNRSIIVLSYSKCNNLFVSTVHTTH